MVFWVRQRVYSRIQVSGTFKRRPNSRESMISQREIGVVSSAFGIILIALSTFVFMPLFPYIPLAYGLHLSLELKWTGRRHKE
jgi:hypothetical protein